MRVCDPVFARSGPLLAINLLFLILWGFAGIGKFLNGMPEWFPDKFGPTILGKFPGVTASFWMLAMAEVIGFGLGGRVGEIGVFARTALACAYVDVEFVYFSDVEFWTVAHE